MQIFSAIQPPRPRTSSRRSPWSRLSIIAATVAVLFGMGTFAASAHVTVNPSESAAGSYSKLTFRVPNEKPDASTVAVSVTLPADNPLPSVSVMPVPGWTVEAKTVKLDPPVEQNGFTLDEAVGTVTWTADDGVGIKPGQFMEFPISVGPIPDVASLTMPADQTYSDGSVAKWDEIAEEGQDPHDLNNPAPVLTISAAGSHGSAAGSSDAGSTNAAGSTMAQILGLAALLIAAVALVTSAIAIRRGGPATAGTGAAAAGTGAGKASRAASRK